MLISYTEGVRMVGRSRASVCEEVIPRKRLFITNDIHARFCDLACANGRMGGYN
jgi:hypothetical protein